MSSAPVLLLFVAPRNFGPLEHRNFGTLELLNLLNHLNHLNSQTFWRLISKSRFATLCGNSTHWRITRHEKCIL